MTGMSTFKNREMVLFDFDGVIVDSMQMNLDILEKILGRAFDADEYRQLFTGNVYEKLKAEFKELLEGDIQQSFFNEYTKRLLEIAPFSDIDAMLEAAARSRKAYIVTSSLEDTVADYLERHQLAEYFDGIFGMETHTSKVVKFRHLLDKGSMQTDQAVFITDTIGDVLEADEVGIDSIAVTWGFHPKDWIADSPHHTLVESVDELRRLFI